MASQIARSLEPNWKPFIGPKVKTRTPLAKVSDKRKADQVIYTQKRRDYLDTHPFCEWPDGCSRVASDLHHKAKRGAHYLDESTFMGLCRVHHRFVHDNENQARAMGILV